MSPPAVVKQLITGNRRLTTFLALRYPRTKLSSSFRDSHVYVCKRAVLDALTEKAHLDSLREEFIPWLCKPQYQRTRREKYGNSEYPPNAPMVL